MIAAIEKVFVLIVVLSGMFLLFLFGLYFDVGEMFVAIIGTESSDAGSDESRRLMELAEANRRNGAERPRDIQSLDRGTGDQVELTAAQRDWIFNSGVLTGADMKKIKESQLKNLGYKDANFIKLESMSLERDKYKATLKRLETLSGDGALDLAIVMVEQAIGEENPENIAVLKDYYELLLRFHYEKGDIEKANQVGIKLIALIDRVIAIKKLGNRDVPSDILQGDIQELEAKKKIIDDTYKNAAFLMKKNGNLDTIPEQEKNNMQVMLNEALASRSITKEEYDKAMEALRGN